MRLVNSLSLLIALSCCAPTLSAATIATEDFNYGPTSGALQGKGSAGNGFSGSWTANSNWTYNTTSLTLSDLLSSGGSVTGNGGAGTIFGRRAFSATLPVNSAYFGSFLSRVDSQTVNPDFDNDPFFLPYWTTSVILGSNSDDDTSGSFVFKAKAYGTNFATVAVEDSESPATGGSITVGTTYLNVFKVDPVAKIMTGWVLTAAQFDHFKADGITEAELNSASLGSGANQVFSRGSNNAPTATVGAVDTLSLFNFKNGGIGVVSYDRIIYSSDSLNSGIGLTAVPEPTSLALFALACVGSWGWTKRKKA